MKRVDVAVLGAGPSGLTAAYCLGKAGARVTVLERAAQCGGLMRGIKRGEFTFDLGRKELYSRFGEVHQLWTELLDGDYREYPHRIGVLYGGKILEKSSAAAGKLSGLSLPQVVGLGGSYLASQIAPGTREASSLADFYRLRYGQKYYEMFVHGFIAKFEGRSPAEMPNVGTDGDVRRFASLRTKQAKPKTEAKDDILFSEQHRWRHPAKGTQQIVDALESGGRRDGVEFLLDAEVMRVETKVEGDHRLQFRHQGTETTLEARYVVSSLPLPLLMKLMAQRPEELGAPPKEEMLFKKAAGLVYLLSHAPPRFPHNWLEVTDPQAKVGRVVNYGTWKGDMVPKGKAGLCLEYFGVEGDEVMRLDKEGLYRLAVEEASNQGLLDPATLTDHLVLQLPQTNPSTAINDRKQAWLQRAAAYVGELPRFFETSRPGMDRATLAGIDAAEACSTGQAMRRRSLASSSAEL